MRAPDERYRLSRYIDGEGTPSEQEATRRLLAEDPDLQAQLEELQAERRRVKLGLLKTPPPVDLTERVLARVAGAEARPSEAPVLPLVRRMAVAAAILFVLLCLGVYLLKDDGSLQLEVEAAPPTLEFVPPDDYASELDEAPVSPLGEEEAAQNESERDDDEESSPGSGDDR